MEGILIDGANVFNDLHLIVNDLLLVVNHRRLIPVAEDGIKYQPDNNEYRCDSISIH
jgi:hypothetical protein